MTQNRPYIIGLTGSSGSGKGAVGEILKSLGCPVIDCDAVAHENMAKGGIAYDDIVSAFGTEILKEDGEIDRKILGGIVFADKQKLEMLNRIAHRYVRQRVEEITAQNKNVPVMAVDAPLLKEAGMLESVDTVWLVTADEKIRLKRVMRRDNITEEAALARFKNQIPLDETEADAVIYNNSDDLCELKASVERKFKECFKKECFKCEKM